MTEKTKKSKTEKIKHLFTSNWLSKLVSLFIATGVWYTIFNHLENTKAKETPVPGTIPIPASKEPSKPPISILSPGGAIPGG